MIEHQESTTPPAGDARFCFGMVPSVVHPSMLAERKKPDFIVRRDLVNALVEARCCQRLAEAIADRVWIAQKPLVEALREQQEYHDRSTREHRGAADAVHSILEGLV